MPHELHITPDFEFQTGDELAFSGDGTVSWGIKFFTWSDESHVGGVANVTKRDLLRVQRMLGIPKGKIHSWTERPLLFESTTLSNQKCAIRGVYTKGVQAIDPYLRVKHYEGKVWLYRLTDDWRPVFDEEKQEIYTNFLLDHLGDRYDPRGAAYSALRTALFKWIYRKLWAWRGVDKCSLFCSAYRHRAWELTGILNTRNANEISPGELIRELVSTGVMEQVKLLKG